ncbi:hypothetical protein [Cellulosimicrobium sp. NPDC057862]|uniref:hypothetical protein n=1 Tax=Cellulosimicrobium sp. NPDC057862 TaxID=3346266 RepID=UPI00366D19E0
MVPDLYDWSNPEQPPDMLTYVEETPGLTLTEYTSYAPQVFDGTLDGVHFYFRERFHEWQIELLAPGVDPAVADGEVIATGNAVHTFRFKDSPLSRLRFVVDSVREHVMRQSCSHDGAGRYCPMCGARMHHEAGEGGD